MNKYLVLANITKPVQYVWYAKSGQPNDHWQKTLAYSNHYLENDGFYTWMGIHSFGAPTSYPGEKLTTNDNDHDTNSMNCASFYGSFGWYGNCHSAHFWSSTDDRTLACNSNNPYFAPPYNVTPVDRGGRAVCNGYSNWGPDAAGAYNTWYQAKIMIR